MTETAAKTTETTEKKKRAPIAHGPIPPPPPADAQALAFDQVAGLMAVRRSRIAVLRRTNPTFPQPIKLGDGTLRWVRSEVWAWFLAQPRGWSTKGGRRLRQARTKPTQEPEVTHA